MTSSLFQSQNIFTLASKLSLLSFVTITLLNDKKIELDIILKSEANGNIYM